MPARNGNRQSGPPESLRVIDHSVVSDALTVMRNRDSSMVEFRTSARVIARALAFEATRDLPVETVTVETPICPTSGMVLRSRIVAMPILRAGLGMIDSFLDIVPSAAVGYVGLRRDEATLQPHEYYRNVPAIDGAHLFILDPMLATGGSVIAALNNLNTGSAASLSLLCFLAAPEGVQAVGARFPSVRIFTASLDERLNDNGYIVPGLGDAGDRLCGTI